ncbi:Gfo/Idh/MocA family protein [Sphingobacterium sp. SG20118]|uniref:Gfo/Idh/MocA family protein n=1 Tax=Sphingobacterium sp. SG20118 TaxID=3367156 RepID=UPI0037DFBF56
MVDDIEIYALRSEDACVSTYAGVNNVFSTDDIDFDLLDFIIISNPTSLHFDTINTLVKYNKPLFIEKPLFSALTPHTDQLVDDTIKSRIITYISCNLRFLDSLRQIKVLIADKRINEVNVYCGSYLPNWRPNVDFREIYSANKEMGGGVHIDLIHELDYLYWLLGKPLVNRSLFKNNSSLNISAFDYANYTWEYPSFTASIILNYYRKDSKRTLEIVTSDGTYLVDLLKNIIYFDGVAIFKSDQRIMDTYDDQMDYFIHHIMKEDKNFNSIGEANNILKLCIQD